jgi:radical SAM superfamily enzyme YgiQ (UPF0313 family)
MKILLISVNNEREPYPVAPIGASYVAGALKLENHNVRILDLCFAEDDNPAVNTVLKEFLPDIIGLSLRNIDNLTYGKSVCYMPRIRDIVGNLKRNTSSPVVVGGSGFSIFPEEVLRYLGLETGIIGEGESAFTAVVKAFAEGGDIWEIQNLCYIRDGVFNANRVATSPFGGSPERSLIDNRAYFELGGMANIQSKRGCPFKCSYCTYPLIEGAGLRLRPPGAVVDELKEVLFRYGTDFFFFVDDIFNFPEDHATALCEELVKSDLRIGWTCFATPMGMTAELAQLMKRAGCKGVEFGSDAGAERTLRGLGKCFTPDDIAYASECCNAIDLPNAHYIIIGGPEEDGSTIRETIALFEKAKPTAVIALTGLRIYPNTQLCERAVLEGIVERDMNLLEPVFYLSPELESSALLQFVSDYAMNQRNWIVPGLGIRCNAEMMLMMRMMGKKGPLWDMLS